MNSLTKLKEAQLRILFGKYDVDDNGCINWNELRTIFVEKTKSLEPSKARTIFKEINVDRNGKISFHEFKSIFTVEIADVMNEYDNDDARDKNAALSSDNTKVHSAIDFAIRKAR